MRLGNTDGGGAGQMGGLPFERTHAKGSFKVMTEGVAERLDADMILLVSSGNPGYKGKLTPLKWLAGEILHGAMRRSGRLQRKILFGRMRRSGRSRFQGRRSYQDHVFARAYTDIMSLRPSRRVRTPAWELIG